MSGTKFATMGPLRLRILVCSLLVIGLLVCRFSLFQGNDEACLSLVLNKAHLRSDIQDSKNNTVNERVMNVGRTLHIDWFQEIVQKPSNYKPQYPHAIRGFIMCVFDFAVPMVISLIHELRYFGNTDLVQVYYCGKELSSISKSLFNDPKLYVELIDVCTLLAEAGILKTEDIRQYQNFYIKPLALLHTTLTEVMILDADDVLARDPAVLYDIQGYKETGTLFFYDRVVVTDEYLSTRVDIGGTERVPYLHSLKDRFPFGKFNITSYTPSTQLVQSLSWQKLSGHHQDSSILLVCKTVPRTLKAMQLLWHLLSVERYQHHFSYGDKEIFWLAFELSETPYFFSPLAASGVNVPGEIQSHPDTVCGSLAQYLPLESNASELLYINGRGVIHPYQNHEDFATHVELSRVGDLIRDIPTHSSLRQKRAPSKLDKEKDGDGSPVSCLHHMGSEKISEEFRLNIYRRILDTYSVVVKLNRLTTPAL